MLLAAFSLCRYLIKLRFSDVTDKREADLQNRVCRSVKEKPKGKIERDFGEPVHQRSGDSEDYTFRYHIHIDFVPSFIENPQI